MGTKKSVIPEIEKLDPRRRKYVANRVKGQSKKTAALAAGFSPAMAATAVQKIETPDVHAAFRALINKVIPTDRLVERLSEGLDAEHTKSVAVSGGEQGEREHITEADFRERREYLKLATQWGGHIPKETADLIVPIQVVIDL